MVLPHGGMAERDYPIFDERAQALASQGYAVVQPNARGSVGYGAAFANAGFGQLGRKSETDIADAVTALARQGLIDPKRVCIVGEDWGGYAALAGVTLFHGLYRCAAAVDGLYDLVPLVQDDNTQTGRLARSLVGVGPRYNPVASALSPVKLAAQADAPVLLVRDDSDLNRPNDQSGEMAAALKAAGKPVEVLVLPGHGGAAEAQANGIATIKALVAFVERYDPPDAGVTAIQAKN